MLVCLIAIPLAALFGSSLPTVVKAIQEGRWPTLADLKSSVQPAKNSPTEPARFIPSNSPTPINGGTAVMIPGDSRLQSAPGNPPPLPPQFPGGGMGHPSSGVVAAGFELSIASTQAAGPGTAGSGGLANGPDRPIPPSQLVTPLLPTGSNPAPIEQSGNVRTTETTAAMKASAADPSSQATAGSDPFSLIQDRLRQLGATYYLLESWGDQKREFRFYCRMAIGGNSQYTRSFWSIDGDPVRAMGQVLGQVESWRSDRP